ncbi:Uncharacterized protein FWK35_00033505, partial [Aphis craccivora]
METHFKNLHGDGLSKISGVMSYLTNVLKPKIGYLNIPDEVLECLVRTRTMKAISSYRTKRRKIQEEIEILGDLLDVNLSNSLEPQFNIFPGISPIQETITFNKSQINNSASNTFNYSKKKKPSEDARDNVLCNKVLSSNTSINNIIPN